MTADLTLYTNPQSRGRIARWALEEVGAPYDVVVLDYGTTMKGADYLAINPMGKVPALVHRGRVVTECAAICAYLADAFPAAALGPSDDERADYWRWLFYAAGPAEAAITNRYAKFEPTAEQGLMFGYGSYDRMVEVLAAAVGANDYIAGNRFTLADVYVGSQVGWGIQFGTLPRHDAFVAYWDRLRERPALVRANRADDALMPPAPA
ncbi:glutathione S-transferase family protein [Sphingomonas sp. CJ99]